MTGEESAYVCLWELVQRVKGVHPNLTPPALSAANAA